MREFPGAKQVANAHLTTLKNHLHDASKGRFSKEKVIAIRDAAKNSIGSRMPAKSLKMKHTINLISELTADEVDDIEAAIRDIMDEIASPILSIPGVGVNSAAMILAEIGDFSRFDSPDKILAYAGMSPSTYQFGQLTSTYAHMEKRGSRYLRYALYNSTKLSAIGTRPLPIISPKSDPRVSTTTSPFPTSPRSSCDSFMPWRNPGKRSISLRSSCILHMLFFERRLTLCLLCAFLLINTIAAM